MPLILAIIFLLFSLQMVAIKFNQIHLMLVDQGSILWDTLQSQDRLNFGDVCFCPIRQTLHMQCISLDQLWKLIAEGAFMPPLSEGPPKLSGTTAILLVFQVDGQHERITCLIYPTSYVRDVEPDHFNTHNNPAGTHLHHCICHATLQYMNDDPNQHREYSVS